jgi:hypothetical protein
VYNFTPTGQFFWIRPWQQAFRTVGKQEHYLLLILLFL